MTRADPASCDAALAEPRRWPCSLALRCRGARAAPRARCRRSQTDVDQIARRARPSVVTVFAQRTRGAAARRDAERRASAPASAPASRSRRTSILTTASVVLRRRARAGAHHQRPAGRGRGRRRGPDLQPRAAARADAAAAAAALRRRGARRRSGDWVIAIGTSLPRADHAVGRQRRLSPPRAAAVAAAAHQHRLSRQQRRRGAQRARRAGRHRAGRARLAGPGGPASRGASAGRAASASCCRSRPCGRCSRACAREGRVRHGYLGVTHARGERRERPRGRRPHADRRAGRERRRPAARPRGSACARGDLIVAFERRARRVSRAARALGGGDAARTQRSSWCGCATRSARAGAWCSPSRPSPMPEWIAGDPRRGAAASPPRRGSPSSSARSAA